MKFRSLNPADGQLIQEYEIHSSAEVESILVKLVCGHQLWRKTSWNERAQVLTAWAQVLLDQRETLAKLITMEMGKPIAQSWAEVDKSINALNQIVSQSTDWLLEEYAPSVYSRSFVRPISMGPVLAIMPWNFPLWQVVRFAGPALLAGNTILLKHSEITPGVGQLIEDTLRIASSHLLLLNCRLGHQDIERLVADSRIRGVTFTGSTSTGRLIGQLAGKNLKKLVLELGGNDAMIVLKDADIDRAAEIGAQARLMNAGQSCIATKRFIVASEIYEDFLERLKQKFSHYIPGNPLDEATRIGPLAKAEFASQLFQTLRLKFTASDFRPHIPINDKIFNGAYFQPVILEVLKNGMAPHDIELFGPVAQVFRVESEQEAIQLTNLTPYGLGASIWSSDIQRALNLSHGLEVGFVALNEQVRSDMGLPFGGTKDSGFGHESGKWGAQEFTRYQAIGIGPAR